MRLRERDPSVTYQVAPGVAAIAAGRLVLLAALLLAACGQDQQAPDTPGARLEAAAAARGLVLQTAGGSLVGSWAEDTDRLCIVTAGKGLRIGALVDYGEGQGCAATGEATRKRDVLRVRFGDCQFEARFDGERISFPASLPPACDRYCTGRASLTALSVARLSDSASEAATLRAPNGRTLCGG